jgi:hypothetical protein
MQNYLKFHNEIGVPIVRVKQESAKCQNKQCARRPNVWCIAGAFDRPYTPEEIMDELEKRVGPAGRKLFERFLRQVNKLQAQQQLEAQAQTRLL